MGWNCQSTAFVNHLADLSRWFAFEVGETGADAKEMPFRCCHFHAGENQETMNGLAILTHETFINQVRNGVTGIVIGDGKTVETFTTGGGNQFFRTRDTVTGEERVGMKVDLERHFREASLD